jgi:hypothetical protein
VPPGGDATPTLVAWHVESGFAEPLQPLDGAPPRTWQTMRLPPGFYDLQLRLPGAGHKALGRHFLDGEHDVDLGAIELPRSGAVFVQLPNEALPPDPERRVVEIYAVRADLDVRLEPCPLPRGRRIALPAGDYVVLEVRDPGRGMAPDVQARMFDTTAKLGGLDVQLVYFRGYGECRASSFVAGGEGLLGLQRGFQVAGAKTRLARGTGPTIVQTAATSGAEQAANLPPAEDRVGLPEAVLAAGDLPAALKAYLPATDDAAPRGHDLSRSQRPVVSCDR